MTPDPLDPAALLLDCAGTLLSLAEPVGETYARFGRGFGATVTPQDAGARFGPAFKAATPLRRDAPSWRPFWAQVVNACTGCNDPALLDALLDFYTRADAWQVAPGAEFLARALRSRGVKVGIVSNWDDRLPALLETLGVTDWVDTVVVSGIEGIEKPDPQIFQRACDRLGVVPGRALHVGDDARADVAGAHAAGCQALRFGGDVVSFHALAQRLGIALPRPTS